MDKQKISHNVLEKATFTFGLIVLITLFSYLISEMFGPKKAPPLLVVTTSYDPNLQGYAFKVTTENLGEQSVANANVSLALYQEGKKVNTATVNYGYLPLNSTETAWTFFNTVKKTGDSLVVSSISFSSP